MTFPTRRTAVAMTLGLLAGPGALAADVYPHRPIRIIVTSGAGGLLDAQTRLYATRMGETLGQPVVVENRPGADGLLAFTAVKQAPADGYTLLSTSDTISIRAALRRDPGYDLEKDFTGIGVLSAVPLMLITATDKPYKNFQDFAAQVKSRPGVVSYASEGASTTTHLAAAILLQQMGLSMLHVPYKSNSAAVPDLTSGRVDVKFSVPRQLASGGLRSLGVSASARLAAFPDIPTLAEQGGPPATYVPWFGLMAAGGTPAPAVQRLSEAMRIASQHPDVLRRIREDGGESLALTPEQFNGLIRQRK